MIRVLGIVFFLTTIALAETRTEVGQIGGAPFRIDVPEHWNGVLFLYCHGYSTTPVTFDRSPVRDSLKAYLDSGAALAQSGYARTGWAVEQAFRDTEVLRRYFVDKYGKPRRTYATGHSMGGFLTMMLVESRPTNYDGGLSMCGPLTAAGTIFTNALNYRVIFDYYFPDVLPDPAHVPPDFKASRELETKLTQLIKSKPAKAELVRRYMSLKSDDDVAKVVDFLTFQLGDIQQRAGGNPVDNRNTIYALAGADDDLNVHIKRYAADPHAFEYVRTYYTPTGRLLHPLLQVHTTYDPLVPPLLPNSYTERTSNVDKQDFYVQQFVRRDGHCNILPGEVGEAVRELGDWVDYDTRPIPGLLSVH